MHPLLLISALFQWPFAVRGQHWPTPNGPQWSPQDPTMDPQQTPNEPPNTPIKGPQQTPMNP